jgi:hypothetical protein
MTVFSPLSLERQIRQRSYHVSPLLLVGALTGAVLFVYLVGRAPVTAVLLLVCCSSWSVTPISQFSLPDSFPVQLYSIELL